MHSKSGSNLKKRKAPAKTQTKNPNKPKTQKQKDEISRGKLMKSYVSDPSIFLSQIYLCQNIHITLLIRFDKLHSQADK